MKTWLALALSVLIMAVIFSRINLGEFGKYVSELNLGLFVAAILFFVPQVALAAYRWQIMIQGRFRITLWQSTKLILASAALNILLPSRVGDLSKAYFVGRGGRMEMKRGMNVVFFEKYIDLASLGIVILTGIGFVQRWDQPTLVGLLFSLGMLAIFPCLFFLNFDSALGFPVFTKFRILGKIKTFLQDSQVYLNEVKKEPKQLGWILFLSVFLWYVHILQFYVIFQALHSQVSLMNVFRLVPLAILVGLVPITVAGVGTRDSAMIYFFAPYENASLMAGVGLFASLRYFVPGLLGLPSLNQYIVKDADAS